VFVGFFCEDYGKCKNCELELRYALMEDKQIFIICLDAIAKETFENTPKHMNLNLFTPEIIVNSIKPTNTSTSPNSFKFAQHMLYKTKINVDSTASAISKFLDSSQNAIVRSFESVKGKGLAGKLDNLSFDWYDRVLWETKKGSVAPKICKVTISFSPIHDISPGIDHMGYNRAPVYSVGKASNSDESD
jgi:hypothetical protein